MDGYYDHHPSTQLDRPIVLWGFMGSLCDRVASSLGALTGLPSVDLDRRVEHRAGRSVSQLVLEAGSCEYRHVEQDVLTQALADRPYGVIALGEGALLHPGNLEAIRASACTVYLQWPLADLARNIRRELDQRPGRWPWFMQRGSVVTALGIQPMLQEREDAYRLAEHTIACAGRTPPQIAIGLKGILGI
jgi:shikimate kinase